jgi:hypothetical protein
MTRSQRIFPTILAGMRADVAAIRREIVDDDDEEAE